MIEQVGGLMGGLTGGRNSAAATGGANMAPNDTIYLCNFRQRAVQTSIYKKLNLGNIPSKRLTQKVVIDLILISRWT
jgi:hypothetical protein